MIHLDKAEMKNKQQPNDKFKSEEIYEKLNLEPVPLMEDQAMLQALEKSESSMGETDSEDEIEEIEEENIATRSLTQSMI